MNTVVSVNVGLPKDVEWRGTTAHADLNFALLRTIEESQRYRKDFDERLQRIGRHPSDLKVLPGVVPIVAKSKSEAEEKREFLETLVPARVGVDLVSSWSIRWMARFRHCPTFLRMTVRGRIWKGS